MIEYLIENGIEILGILISIFIAYHISFLSRGLSNQARLEHKEKVKKVADELVHKIHTRGLRNKVYLVNTNRYFKDYPGNQEKLVSGYSHIRAEIKASRYNGLQFFCSMPEQAYLNTKGNISLKGSEAEKVFLVYPVGLVPYEWIEHIDPDGDEHGWVPLIYCKFKGNIYWKSWWRKLIPFGYPYKELMYYRKSEVYREGNDPKDMEWSLVEMS